MGGAPACGDVMKLQIKVNKNGIIMYDRENSENSDCGPLAFEYLYYQAGEDGVWKSFETQISLYTQKKEYTNKCKRYEIHIAI